MGKGAGWPRGLKHRLHLLRAFGRIRMLRRLGGRGRPRSCARHTGRERGRAGPLQHFLDEQGVLTDPPVLHPVP
eukprot:9432262-Pyramimonas_sp.AAC.1